MDDHIRDAMARLASRHPELALLVLFGSRARGDVTERSDWDLGYVASAGFDRDGFYTALVGALGTERIDLVDLDRAGGLVRFRAARDGMPIHEAAGAFARFWLAAVSFWCDMGPIFRAGYDDVLAELPR